MSESEDYRLIKKLAEDEEQRLAKAGSFWKQHRNALAVRKEMEGRYRKAGIARQEAQVVMDQIQREVAAVEKVILESHRNLVEIGEVLEIPKSTIPGDDSG